MLESRAVNEQRHLMPTEGAVKELLSLIGPTALASVPLGNFSIYPLRLPKQLACPRHLVFCPPELQRLVQIPNNFTFFFTFAHFLPVVISWMTTVCHLQIVFTITNLRLLYCDGRQPLYMQHQASGATRACAQAWHSSIS